MVGVSFRKKEYDARMLDSMSVWHANTTNEYWAP